MSQYLLTTKQAADFLGVSKAFLERDRWAGARIPYIKVGTRAVRYDPNDIEDYLRGQSRRTTGPQGGRNV